MYIVSRLTHWDLLAEICLTELGHQAISWWTHGDLLLMEPLKIKPSSIE